MLILEPQGKNHDTGETKINWSY